MLRQHNTMTKRRRSTPYPELGCFYFLPEHIWVETIKTLAYYGQFESEGLTYWGGVVGSAGEMLVTSLLRLNHNPQGGGVRPTLEEMRALVRTLSQRDEKLIAQIHTHPKEAFHSWGDNENATSYHQGFLSIVLPYYGRSVNSITDCAVYEYTSEFSAWNHDEIKKRLIIQPQIVDLMPRPIQEANHKGTLWNALSRKLSFIAPKKR